MKLKWLELLEDMFWRQSSVMKNSQFGELFQTIQDNRGSEQKRSISADLGTIPSTSFDCLF